MTKLLFVGQAPSRVGDGRPFSGPSGKRLASLLDLEDYEDLRSRVRLANLFPESAERRGARGDHFDSEAARELGRHMIVALADEGEDVVVVACGHEVFKALTGRRMAFFRTLKVEGVEIRCFPHPSGASAFWNHPENVERARYFLKRLIRQRAIDMAQ